MSDATPPRPTARASHLAEVALVFTRLGFTAFGGPLAHVAMMEREIVDRRKWLDRQQFLDAYGALNFIPGPNSTELAIHLGYVRAGLRGLLTAGVCFITPAVLIILPIAWLFVRYGQTPHAQSMLVGINSAVLAIVVAACWRFARTAIRDRFTAGVAVAALIARLALLHAPAAQPDLLILALAALAAVAMRLRWRAALAPIYLPASTYFPAAVGKTGGLWQLAAVFLKIGATLFGSGYVLLSYLQQSVVDQYHWLDKPQLLSAISVGQFTPGPLLTTATFVGYLRGWQIYGTTIGAVCGGVVATAAIFAPAFVLVAIVGPFLKRLRNNPIARLALEGVNAAVVALIAVTAMRLGSAALVFNRAGADTLIIFGASLAALWRLNVNATWTLIGGALFSILWRRGW